MPRYFFNIHDGRDIPDEEGTELPDLDAAKKLAVEVAGETLRDCGAEFWNIQDWQLDVTDEMGLQVATVKVTGHVQL